METKRFVAIVVISVLIALDVLFIVAVMIKHTAKDPQEERTARPEQMREGFGQTTGHERRGPTPSEQSDPIDDDNLQEIRLRLDHLESLLMKLPERIGLAECKCYSLSGSHKSTISKTVL